MSQTYCISCKTYTETYKLNCCLVCKYLICDNCEYNYGCKLCQKKCPSCDYFYDKDEIFKFLCLTCNYMVCNICHISCNTCVYSGCRQCLYECKTCFNYICYYCIYYCIECNDVICKNDLLYCENKKHYLCKNCTQKCFLCNLPLKCKIEGCSRENNHAECYEKAKKEINNFIKIIDLAKLTLDYLI